MIKLLALLALGVVLIRLAFLCVPEAQEWADSEPAEPWLERLWWADLLIVALLAFSALASPAHATVIPERSALYRHALQNTVAAEFGLNAPVARFAAQIHQESAWRPTAESPYAQGLAQFTPATAEWIAQVYPALRPADPWDPQWSMRAQVIYMRHLIRTLGPAASECDTWAFALSAYNGGPGWVARDRRLASASGADPARWWGHVEHYTRRAEWARRENRDYPRRILLRLEPAYIAAGWPGGAVCP